jgi:hypothetical protein
MAELIPAVKESSTADVMSSMITKRQHLHDQQGRAGPSARHPTMITL